MLYIIYVMESGRSILLLWLKNILCPFVTICPQLYCFLKIYVDIYNINVQYMYMYSICIYTLYSIYEYIYIYSKKCTVWTGRDDCWLNFSRISKSGTIKWRQTKFTTQNTDLNPSYPRKNKKLLEQMFSDPFSATFWQNSGPYSHQTSMAKDFLCGLFYYSAEFFRHLATVPPSQNGCSPKHCFSNHPCC